MFYYTRPSESVLGSAVVTVETGTADAAYPVTNLINQEPQRPSKLTTGDGAWMVDLGANTRVDFVSLIHHNFDQGLAVALQGNTSPTWTAPTFAAGFSVPALRPDGFGQNVWLDLSMITSVLLRTLRYWRIVIPTANSRPLALGELVMTSAVHTFGQRNIQLGSTRSWERPAKLHKTDVGVRHRYDMGTTLRKVTVQVQPEATIWDEVDAWWRDAQGAVRPFVIVPHSGEPDAWYVTFADDTRAGTRTRPPAYHTASLEFVELARGLAP